LQHNEENESDDEWDLGRDNDFIDDADEVFLQESDLLDGYIPDDGYDPATMEEDGPYSNECSWTYEDPPQRNPRRILSSPQECIE